MNDKLASICKLLVFLAFFYPYKIFAQEEETPAPRKGEAKVRLNINATSFIDPLPFDVPFRIYGIKYDETLLGVKLYFKQGRNQVIDISKDQKARPWEYRVDQKKPFMLYVSEPLKPNTAYTFKFELKRKLTEEEVTVLKGLVADQFLIFLNKRLSDKVEFELKKADIDQIALNVISILKAHLLDQGLTLKQGSLQTQYYNLIQSSLLGLTSLYEETYHSPLQLLNGNALFLQNEVNNLNAVQGEAGFTNSPAFTTIQSNLQALASFANGMNPNNALTIGQLNSLLDNSKKVLDNLTPAVAPNSALYKKELPEIKDILTEIDNGLKQYKNGPLTAKPIVDNYAMELAKILSKIIYSDLTVEDETDGDFETRATYYLSADIGVALFPTIGKGSPYFGTNIYLRPVNKQRPIYRGPYNPLRSFSFLIAISFVSIAETGKRNDLLGNTFNLLAGGGYRITDQIRLNGGFVFYKNINKNPLGGTDKIGVNGFCSLSFDWDISSTFKTFFGPSVPKTP